MGGLLVIILPILFWALLVIIIVCYTPNVIYFQGQVFTEDLGFDGRHGTLLISRHWLILIATIGALRPIITILIIKNWNYWPLY